MGNGLDMDVDATRYQITVLDAVGDDLARASDAARSDIDWLSGTLGKGPMGTRFSAEYTPSRAALTRRLDACQRRTTGLARAGRHCVDAYATADARAEAEMLRAWFR